MKKTYLVSIFTRKVRTPGPRSRLMMSLGLKRDIAFWASPEGIRCTQALRLWQNLADSEIPVSGRVVARLVDIVKRAFNNTIKRGYATNLLTYDWENNAPVGVNPRAQYVLWREAFPNSIRWDLYLGTRRV